MKIATTTEDFLILGENNVDKVKYLKKSGFKYIDMSFYDRVVMEPFMSDDWKEKALELKALENEIGVKYVQAHSPAGNYFREDNADYILKSTIRSIEVCEILDIENIVVHFAFAKDISKEEFLEKNAKFFGLLIPVMEKTGVNVLVENSAKADLAPSGYYYPSTAKEMLEFLEYKSHPMIHACWDTGHANMDGPQYGEIIELGDRLKAVHINDNMGNSDQHIAPFMGTINMDEVISALIDIDYKGYFTLESCNIVKNGDNWLQKRRVYPESTKLFNPPLAVHEAKARFNFEIAKACLEAYGIYEE